MFNFVYLVELCSIHNALEFVASEYCEFKAVESRSENLRLEEETELLRAFRTGRLVLGVRNFGVEFLAFVIRKAKSRRRLLMQKGIMRNMFMLKKTIVVNFQYIVELIIFQVCFYWYWLTPIMVVAIRCSF